jgi:hypothetical protein
MKGKKRTACKYCHKKKIKCQKSTANPDICFECLCRGPECEPQDDNPLVRKKRSKGPRKQQEESSDQGKPSEAAGQEDEDDFEEREAPEEPDDDVERQAKRDDDMEVCEQLELREQQELREEQADDMDDPAGSTHPQEDEEETRTRARRLLAEYEANLALWPARTRRGILLPEFKDQPSFISAAGFVDLVELRQPIPGDAKCPLYCGERFEFISDVARHMLEQRCPNVYSAAPLIIANANDCIFKTYCGQECHTKPCSIIHHFLQGVGIYCSCGLPFESLYHLGYHAFNEPTHVDLEPGRCASLASWYQHVKTSDKMRAGTSNYGQNTRFIFRSVDDVRKGSLPLPTAYKLPHSGEDPMSVWLLRSNQDQTGTPNLEDSKESTLAERRQEHQKIFGVDSGIITIIFSASARIFPTIISPLLNTACPSLLADDQNVLPCSVMAAGMALGELAIAASSGRKGNVVGMDDSLTSDLEHLAQLCIAAEPFDFNILISNVHIKILSQLHALSFPPEAQLHVECHAATGGYWLLFDSHELWKAILRYRPGLDVGLAYQHLFYPSDATQHIKDCNKSAKLQIRLRRSSRLFILCFERAFRRGSKLSSWFYGEPVCTFPCVVYVSSPALAASRKGVSRRI